MTRQQDEAIDVSPEHFLKGAERVDPGRCSDVAFIAGLMTQRVPFVVAELGVDADPFMLQLYATVMRKSGGSFRSRRDQRCAARKAQGAHPGNKRNALSVTAASCRHHLARARISPTWGDDVELHSYADG